MSLQRSKSTPHPLQSLTISTAAGLQAKPPVRSVSQHHLPAKAPLLPHHYYGHAPPKSPWVEREDAFSLGGFFTPSQDDKEWSWLHSTEEEEEDAGEADEEPRADGRESHEEVTGEVISQEDKMGVLALDTVLFGNARPDEGYLLSPYLHEPVDDDSLYCSLSAVRRMHDRPESEPKSSVTFPAGGLFFEKSLA